MLIKLMSDLHLEASPDWRPNVYPKDSDTTLVLAGDICEIERSTYLEEFLKDMSEQFKYVIHVPGNHEYYGGHIKYSAEKLDKIIEKIDNVYSLNNNSLILEDVKFIGTTLWTDLNKGNPISKLDVESGMNDYYKIRIDSYRKLRVNDTIKLFNENVKFIKQELQNFDGNTVVLSHHAPSSLSIHEDYMGDPLNYGYYTDLSDIILDFTPNFWFHGHMHHSFDYEIGETRVICNPKGYPRGRGNENKSFNDNKTINI